MSVDGMHAIAATSQQHSVPGAQLLQLVDLLEFWSIDAQELLAGTGLSRSMLEEPGVRVSFDTYDGSITRARLLTGEPALGIFLGLRRRISMYGFLGFAAMSASTLGEAMTLGARYSSTVTTAVELRMHVEAGLAALRVIEHSDPGKNRDVATFALMLGLNQMGRALTGRHVPGELHLTIPKPAYYDRFAHLLADVRFSQPVTQLVMDAEHLNLPLVASDRAGLRLAEAECERALCDLGLDAGIIGRVRSLVSTPTDMRSLDEVASCLRMSPRTLKRRLAAQGASFSGLLEEERLKRARFLLQSTRLSLNEVSERLGYSTLPNFARAFRRWSGQTPAAFRREHASHA
jgi:AraC-like DNA-binding protein